MSFLHNSVVSLLKRLRIYEKRNQSYSSTIVNILGDQKESVILDIGSGSGKLANSLCYGENLVIGLDLNRNVFKNPKNRSFQPILADAHKMPFVENTFNALISISCLEHLASPSLAIQEIARITKQNGICIVQLPNLQWILEPHTKFPLLAFMPKTVKFRILKSSGYIGLNFGVTLKNGISWFTQSGFINTYMKSIFHQLKPFQILPWPLGWFLVFRKYFQ